MKHNDVEYLQIVDLGGGSANKIEEITSLNASEKLFDLEATSICSFIVSERITLLYPID